MIQFVKVVYFAEYSGLTQTGCTRGMLDKFRERGAKRYL